jgi:benzodiazapine receptor
MVNGLAHALPLNGQTTGDVSNKLDVLFTPASYVFSIWGLIYLLLAVWVIRGFKKASHVYRTTHIPFLMSCLFNIAWISSGIMNIFL